MKKLYYKLLRDFAAVRILAALVASPGRHAYIEAQVVAGDLSNEEATAKNVHKARLMADQLVRDLKNRKQGAGHE